MTRNLDDVSQEEFYDQCVELWRGDGCPILGDMGLIILERYNNAAIDAIMSDVEDDDGDDDSADDSLHATDKE